MNDYEPSDSEDDYNETEKELLKKVRNREKEYSDSEVSSIFFYIKVPISNFLLSKIRMKSLMLGMMMMMRVMMIKVI